MINKSVVKKELTDTKLLVVKYLNKKGYVPWDDVKDYIKSIKGDVTNRWIRRVFTELNHEGLITYRSNKEGGREVKLDNDKVHVEYERDKFVPDISFMLFGFLVAVIMSTLATSFEIVGEISYFIFGVTYMFMVFISIMIYKIFKTPDLKKFYYYKLKEQ